jgi:hypothetical protein
MTPITGYYVFDYLQLNMRTIEEKYDRNRRGKKAE